MNLTDNKSGQDSYDACLMTLTKLSTDARTLNIARTLKKHGKKVCIISFDQGDKFELEGVDLINLPAPESRRIWQRMIEFRKKLTKVLPRVNSRNILAMDLYTLPAAYRLSKASGAKLIYDSREIYSALSTLAGKKIRQKILTAIERYFIRFAGSVIVSGELDRDYLAALYKNLKDIRVIMNLPEFKEKIKTDIIRKRTGIPPYKLIIVYQGMLMKGRGLEKLLVAMKYLDNHALVIIGEGGEEFTLKQLANSPELRGKVFFIGAVPYNELHEWTCGADIGYCFIEPISFSYELALPNKLFEYAMAGVPSLTSSLPAIERILEKSGIGLSIPHYSGAEAIAGALIAISSENLRNKLISNCLSAAKIYSYESQEDKVLELLD